MKHIAIFASGKGTNTQAVIEYFKNHPSVKVALVVTNNPAAGVIKIAHANKIISVIVNNRSLNNEELMNRVLDALKIEFVALAGFLQLIPDFLLKKFEQRIINIHPALLPQFGGKGMYGMKVHEAVLAGKQKETGMTIHYLNEKYDDGEIILQKKILLEPNDTAETISAKIQKLEHEWYSKTIEGLLV